MLAFTILAALTGMLTRSFVNNVEKGTTALSHRELREAADTIFRKMIYEWQQYNDGDARTLDEEYGNFANLRGWQRDKWAVYRYELEKKPRAVVGTAPDGEEGLFESEEGDETVTPPPAAPGSSPGTGGVEGGASQTGIELLHMRLSIYWTDGSSGEPLLVLSTWIDPERGQVIR